MTNPLPPSSLIRDTKKESLKRIAFKLWQLSRLKVPLPRRRVVVSATVTAALLVGLWFSLQLAQQKQKVQKATGNDVLLSLNASQTTVAPGESFTVTVYIDDSASNYHLSAADLTISYPESLFSLNRLEAGSFFAGSHTPGRTEMLALGISCQQPADCPFQLRINDQTREAYCVNNTCSNSDTPYGSPGQARISLGAPCTVSEPWACYTKTGVGQLAILHFSVKGDAPAGTATIGFGQSSVSASEFTDPDNPVNVLNVNQLPPIAMTITSPASPTPTPTSTPTPTPTFTPTPTPSFTPTPSPTPTLSPTPTMSPTPAPDKGHLSFLIRYEGIRTSVSNSRVRLILKNPTTNEEIARWENVSTSFVENSDGVFSGTVNNINTGTYRVLIKGWAHLQKNLGVVEIIANQTTEKDWSGSELLAGDITGSDNQPPDNRVDGADFSLFISEFNPFTPAPAGTRADFDLNDYVNGGDFALLVGNFNPFISGEE